MHAHPGIKSALVRLIGNLVHRNRANQDLVIRLGGIQLILNCAKADTRQPMIREWALLATRYVCEGNEKAQVSRLHCAAAESQHV